MLKKIGIIGGLSPESTSSYYLYITRTYAEKFKSYEYPDIIIYSVNLEKYHSWRQENRWDLIAKDLTITADKLKNTGADFGLIATNTMHKVFDEVQKSVDMPLLNIIDETSKQAKKLNLKKLGLLGTKYTMSDGFYHQRLLKNGLTAVSPDINDQEIIHQIIVEELVQGKFLKKSKSEFLKIIDKLSAKNVDGIILGCTEIPLLINQQDSHLAFLDTAVIHADAALEYALKPNFDLKNSLGKK